jgi:ABC-type dipeptide/oligopeptide/nickel transport system permease subunit
MKYVRLILTTVAFLFLFLSLSTWWWIPSGGLEQNMEKVLQSFSAENWLGTDSLGRDYWRRVLLATRSTLVIAGLATILSFLIGGVVAQWLARSKGWEESFISRSLDLLQGLPSFLIIAVVMSWSPGHSLVLLIVLMGLIHWPHLTRLLHAEISKLQVEMYVEASRALGASETQVFWRHLAPALKRIVTIWFCVHLPSEMMFESSMSFLGFGVQSPQTSLGALILEGWPHLHTNPQLLLAPATVIMILIFGIQGLVDQTLNRKNKTSPSLTR